MYTTQAYLLCNFQIRQCLFIEVVRLLRVVADVIPPGKRESLPLIMYNRARPWLLHNASRTVQASCPSASTDSIKRIKLSGGPVSKMDAPKDRQLHAVLVSNDRHVERLLAINTCALPSGTSVTLAVPKNTKTREGRSFLRLKPRPAA